MNNKLKATELYTLMANRCKQSKFTKNQDQIYSEMVNFMKECQSAEEIEIKIKKSKYYLAPSVAQTKDMITVFLEIAKENNLSELTQLLENKLLEIDTNDSAIYNSDYLTKTQMIITKYAQTLEAFTKIFECYVRFELMEEIEEAEIKNIQDEINKAFNNLSTPSSDFNELAKIDVFKKLIPLNNMEYELFVEKVLNYKNITPNYNDKLCFVQNELEETWNIIQGQKQEIIGFGKGEIKNSKIRLCTVIAPSDQNGRYTFTDEEAF